MDTKQEAAQRQRRRFSAEYKRQVVEETLSGRESVSIVARRHDLNTNLLFTWRRQYQRGLLAQAATLETALVPIRVTEPECASGQRPAPPRGQGELELTLSRGHRVCVRGAVDPAILRVALEVLSR